MGTFGQSPENGCGYGACGNGHNHGNTWLCLQNGDTFSLQFQYMEDENPMELPEGYDLIIGIYSAATDELLQSGMLSDGTLHKLSNGTYLLSITHETSLKMTGQVIIELTIVNEARTVVDHASDIVYLVFDYRRNNRLI